MIATLGGNAASLAAKPVTTTTPVVFYGNADPVESGLVASLNRPGGNVTGVVTLNIDTGQKRLELGSTTARSGDEVALIADTISHYPPVLIASLSNNSSRRRPRKKTPIDVASPSISNFNGMAAACIAGMIGLLTGLFGLERAATRAACG